MENLVKLRLADQGFVTTRHLQILPTLNRDDAFCYAVLTSNFLELKESYLIILDPEAEGLLGYVYTGSDKFRSVWDQIHCGTDPLCLHGTSSKLERYGSIWDRLHKWTHFVPYSSSNPYRIISLYVDTRLIHTNFVSKWIQSRVNAALQ